MKNKTKIVIIIIVYVVPVLLCKCLEQLVKLYKYEAYEHLLSESEQSSKFNKIEINITFLFCSQLEMTKLSTQVREGHLDGGSMPRGALDAPVIDYLIISLPP